VVVVVVVVMHRGCNPFVLFLEVGLSTTKSAVTTK
jgi:hypothetical protein